MGTVSGIEFAPARDSRAGALFKGKPKVLYVLGRIQRENGDVQTLLRRLDVERELRIIPNDLDDPLGEPVAAHGFRHGLAQGVMAAGQFHIQVCGRFLQARNMIMEPENSRTGRRGV